MEDIICRRGQEGVSPEAIAREVQQSVKYVQEVLAQHRIDWAPARVGGRPPKRLSVGQQVFIERAYPSMPVSRIAARVHVPVQRVKRYLITRVIEPRHAKAMEKKQDDRRQRMLRAVQMYLAGEKVKDICRITRIRAPVLYRALRERNIELRAPQRKERHNVGANIVPASESPD